VQTKENLRSSRRAMLRDPVTYTCQSLQAVLGQQTTTAYINSMPYCIFAKPLHSFGFQTPGLAKANPNERMGFTDQFYKLPPTTLIVQDNPSIFHRPGRTQNSVTYNRFY
jgi:hypothetical protein